MGWLALAVTRQKRVRPGSHECGFADGPAAGSGIRVDGLLQLSRDRERARDALCGARTAVRSWGGARLHPAGSVRIARGAARVAGRYGRAFVSHRVVALLLALTAGMSLLTPDQRYWFGRIDYHVKAKHAEVAAKVGNEPVDI